MKTNKVKVIFTIALVTIFTGCLTEEEGSENQLEKIDPMNMIVLLDLSNRIDPQKNPGQAENDQLIIKNVLKIFGERQRQFGYMISKDHFAIVCANQADPSFQKAQFIDGLNINMEGHMNHPKYLKRSDEVVKNSALLYEQAIEKAESGADIYTWFKDHLPNRLRGNNYVNKVIILTDGYLAFDDEVAARKSKGTQIDWSDFHQLRNHPDNWKSIYDKKDMGFTPHSINYGNTEVLVMELKPRKTEIHSHELDLLKHFWKDWLQKMEIESELVPQFDSKDQLNYTLEKFILNS